MRAQPRFPVRASAPFIAGPSVVLIESPGKIGAMTDALRGAGHSHFEVLATGGHIMASPKSLTPLGIDSGFRETLRGPISPSALEKLAGACEGKHVLMMTDPDQEGDVIAVDLLLALSGRVRGAYRARTSAITASDVDVALRQAEPVHPADAIPGRARAAFDRLVGATLSSDGVAAGRVSTPVLHEMANRANAGLLPVGEVTLDIEAGDGGVFTATMPVSNEAAAKALLSLVEQSGGLGQPLPVRAANTAQPYSTAEILAAAWSRRAMRPSVAAGHLQEAWQKGRISYPRTTGHSIARDHLAVLARSASAAGLGCDMNAILEKSADLSGAAHEGLYPTVDVPPLADFDLLGDDAIIATLICRQGIDAAQGWEMRPDWSGISSRLAANKITSLPFRRPALRGLGRGNEPMPGFRPWSEERAFLHVASGMGLGRPSTWPALAEKFETRELITRKRDGSGWNVLLKGVQWLSHDADRLLAPEVSLKISAGLDALVSDEEIAAFVGMENMTAAEIEARLDEVVAQRIYRVMEGAPDVRDCVLPALAGSTRGSVERPAEHLSVPPPEEVFQTREEPSQMRVAGARAQPAPSGWSPGSDFG